MNKTRNPLPALLFLLLGPSVFGEEPWINSFDSSRDLWLKINPITKEKRYLYRYGSSPDQVSYLTEEEIAAVRNKNRLQDFLASEKTERSRGFGDSLFSSIVQVQDIIAALEGSGWEMRVSAENYRVFTKRGVERTIRLPLDKSKRLRTEDFHGILSEAGLALSPPESEPSVSKNRNK